MAVTAIGVFWLLSSRIRPATMISRASSAARSAVTIFGAGVEEGDATSVDCEQAVTSEMDSPAVSIRGIRDMICLPGNSGAKSPACS
ncbi:hypothetical protein ATE62_08855 [Sphingopyxis sp. HIX]|nr:hypothetical protein ATE62_08855 [Sphingopyxis sp. HIX]